MEGSLSFWQMFRTVYGESVGPMGSRLLKAWSVARLRQQAFAERMVNEPAGSAARSSERMVRLLEEEAKKLYNPNSPENTEKAIKRYDDLKS